MQTDIPEQEVTHKDIEQAEALGITIPYTDEIEDLQEVNKQLDAAIKIESNDLETVSNIEEMVEGATVPGIAVAREGIMLWGALMRNPFRMLSGESLRNQPEKALHFTKTNIKTARETIEGNIEALKRVRHMVTTRMSLAAEGEGIPIPEDGQDPQQKEQTVEEAKDETVEVVEQAIDAGQKDGEEVVEREEELEEQESGGDEEDDAPATDLEATEGDNATEPVPEDQPGKETPQEPQEPVAEQEQEKRIEVTLERIEEALTNKRVDTGIVPMILMDVEKRKGISSGKRSKASEAISPNSNSLIAWTKSLRK